MPQVRLSTRQGSHYLLTTGFITLWDKILPAFWSSLLFTIWICQNHQIFQPKIDFHPHRNIENPRKPIGFHWLCEPCSLRAACMWAQLFNRLIETSFGLQMEYKRHKPKQYCFAISNFYPPPPFFSFATHVSSTFAIYYLWAGPTVICSKVFSLLMP